MNYLKTFLFEMGVCTLYAVMILLSDPLQRKCFCP